MAVVDLEIKRVELEAEDTLQRNRAALEISQQRVRELRASQENSRRRLRKIQRRLQEAGVSLDDAVLEAVWPQGPQFTEEERAVLLRGLSGITPESIPGVLVSNVRPGTDTVIRSARAKLEKMR